MAKSKPFVVGLVLDALRSVLKGNEPAMRALGEADAALVDEFDVFVRNGNRTDWRRDQMAATSAKVEKLKDSEGYALTYSTMEGRRVDDIIHAVLDFVSGFIYPAEARKDGKTNHRRAERDKWIISLGYVRSDVEGGKGKRVTFNGENPSFSKLRKTLEEKIPQRFEGTKLSQTAKVQIPLVAPGGKLPTRSFYTLVYRPGQPAEKVEFDAQELSAYIQAGWTFSTNSKGEIVGETAIFYAELIQKLAARAARNAKKQKQQQQQQMDQTAEVHEVVDGQETVETVSSIDEVVAQAAVA